MEEFDIQTLDEFFESHLSRIVRKKGVLLLGPHFGRTREGQTASDTIRDLLRNSAGGKTNLVTEPAPSAYHSTAARNERRALRNALLSQLPGVSGKIMRDALQEHLLHSTGFTDEQKDLFDSLLDELCDTKSADAEDQWLEKLDDDFDNLFMLKSPTSQQELFKLRGRLAKHYQAMQPGSLFDQVAQLPFRAIISCTPDLMLRKSFEALGIPHDFHYYAHNGKELRQAKEGVTILYNLFGTAEDEDTLIVTYEEFYKFFASLLGSDKQMPTALTYILQEAEFFMLLGFNLEKWYIPPIVRKLNQERNTSGDNKRFSVLTLDSQFRPETRHKLSTAFVVLQEETELVLEALHQKVSDHEAPPQAARPPSPDKARKQAVFNLADASARSNELLKALELLIENARLFDLDAATVATLKDWERQISAAKKAFHSSQITFQELGRTLSLVGTALLEVLEKLRRDHGLDPEQQPA